MAGAQQEPSTRWDYRTLRGIIPTVLTPFEEDERVDEVALRAQVQYLLNAGVHGLVLLGSIGECAYLNDEDRETVIRTAVDVARASSRSVPIVVGITAYSTYMAAEQMRQAHRLGAQAVMVSVPQYFKLGFEDVKRHFVRLGALDLLPALYYHYPAVTGYKFGPAEIAELLALPNVIGIKETTFDLLSVRRHIERTRDLGRIFFAGSELVFSQFMDIGGHGVIGTGSLIMPQTAVSMYDAYGRGDRTKAVELQAFLFETMPLAKDVRAPVDLVRTAFLLAIKQGVNVQLDASPAQSRLKAALAQRGVPIKPIARSPLPAFTPRDEAAVMQAMERIRRIEGTP
jgi:dihydrodipicolinate synthase/N-acetylneuraminate lyase